MSSSCCALKRFQSSIRCLWNSCSLEAITVYIFNMIISVNHNPEPNVCVCTSKVKHLVPLKEFGSRDQCSPTSVLLNKRAENKYDPQHPGVWPRFLHACRHVCTRSNFRIQKTLASPSPRPTREVSRLCQGSDGNETFLRNRENRKGQFCITCWMSEVTGEPGVEHLFSNLTVR